MTIFEALRLSHDVQRALAVELTQSQGDLESQQQLFEQLKIELAAHAAAEERHFYMPLMEHDQGLDLSRHAISEHHEMDELVENIENAHVKSKEWLKNVKALADKVHHHLSEEEHKFFQMAGKILTERQKEQLALDYLAEMDHMKLHFSETAS